MGGAGHSEQACDAELFERLFREHGATILGFCLRRTGDRAAAEEARSVVFFEAWRRRAEVDLTTRAALPWLYGVAVNVLRNHGRSRRRGNAALRRLPVPRAELDPAEEIACRVDARDRARGALLLIDALPRGEREVVLLCLAGDFSYRAAADLLGLPIGTIRSRLSRARARLSALVPEPSR